MKIWNYIAFQYLKSVLGVLLFILGLFFILTYMEDSQHYLNNYNPSWRVVFLYYFWQVPSITIQFLPFTILIGGIICNWILARHGEISALRAAGLSVINIAAPMLCVGLLFTVGQFILSEVVLPYSMTQFLRVRNVSIEKKPDDLLFIESKWLKSQDEILHFDTYDKQELQMVEFFKSDATGHLTQIVHANSGYFDTNKKRWVLRSALVTNFDVTANLLGTEIQGNYATHISFEPPKLLSQTRESSELSYWQLEKLIVEAEQAGANVSDRIADLYMKMSAPFGNLLFIFLTIPFALRKERQEETYLGIIICVAIALLYWMGTMALRSFAAKGVLNPLFAAWIMNILLAFLDYMFVRKLDKGQ